MARAEERREEEKREDTYLGTGSETTEFFLLKPRHLTTSSEYNQLEPTANDWSAYVQWQLKKGITKENLVNEILSRKITILVVSSRNMASLTKF